MSEGDVAIETPAIGFKPRWWVLVVLLVVFALWLGFLVFLSAKT